MRDFEICFAHGQSYRLAVGSTLTIGRLNGDLTFEDQGLLSRTHCQVSVSEKGVYVADLGSLNGTWVNRDRLQQRKLQILRESDRVHIGELSFQVRLGGKRPALWGASPRAGRRFTSRRSTPSIGTWLLSLVLGSLILGALIPRSEKFREILSQWGELNSLLIHFGGGKRLEAKKPLVNIRLGSPLLSAPVVEVKEIVEESSSPTSGLKAAVEEYLASPDFQLLFEANPENEAAYSSCVREEAATSEVMQFEDEVGRDHSRRLAAVLLACTYRNSYSLQITAHQTLDWNALGAAQLTDFVRTAYAQRFPAGEYKSVLPDVGDARVRPCAETRLREDHASPLDFFEAVQNSSLEVSKSFLSDLGDRCAYRESASVTVVSEEAARIEDAPLLEKESLPENSAVIDESDPYSVLD